MEVTLRVHSEQSLGLFVTFFFSFLVLDKFAIVSEKNVDFWTWSLILSLLLISWASYLHVTDFILPD